MTACILYRCAHLSQQLQQLRVLAVAVHAGYSQAVAAAAASWVAPWLARQQEAAVAGLQTIKRTAGVYLSASLCTG
jgi:hypothetical protein